MPENGELPLDRTLDGRKVHRIPEEGIPIRSLTKRQIIYGKWHSFWAWFFYWLYGWLLWRGLRKLGEKHLKRAFFFTNGKIPLTDESLRRNSISSDYRHLDRDVPIGSDSG